MTNESTTPRTTHVRKMSSSATPAESMPMTMANPPMHASKKIRLRSVQFQRACFHSEHIFDTPPRCDAGYRRSSLSHPIGLNTAHQQLRGLTGSFESKVNHPHNPVSIFSGHRRPAAPRRRQLRMTFVRRVLPRRLLRSEWPPADDRPYYPGSAPAIAPRRKPRCVLRLSALLPLRRRHCAPASQRPGCPAPAPSSP